MSSSHLRAGFVALALAVAWACGPSEGGAYKLVRNYRGAGRHSTVGQTNWWNVTLDFRDRTFTASRELSGTTVNWSGTIENQGDAGAIKLTPVSCGTDTCSAPLYGFEIPEVGLVIANPLIPTYPMTLVAPGDCTAISSSTIQTVASELDAYVSPYSAPVVGAFNLSMQSNGSGTLSGALFRFVTNGIDPTPFPSIAGTANGNCLNGEFTLPAATQFRMIGNYDTGLYAGMGYFSSQTLGFLGMSRADTLLADELVGVNFLGAGPRTNLSGSCPSGQTPANSLGFEAFGLTFASKTSASAYAICDQGTMTQESYLGPATFRMLSAGKLDILGDSGTYEGHGFIQKIGSRIYGFLLEADPSPSPSPAGTFRVIVGQ